MDTSKMQHFEELGTSKLINLLNNSEELVKLSSNLYEAMDQTFVRTLIHEVVAQYNIGQVTDVFEIFGGYVNRSFGIYTNQNGETKEYFVRMYKKGVTEKEISFEHALIGEAKANGLAMAAGIIPNNAGTGFVKETIGSEVRYFAIYEYLTGEDKYTWLENELNNEEYASAAEVMATFHNATKNFDPKGLERIEPKIMELMPMLIDTFRDYAKKDKGTKFDEYFLKNLDGIIEVINRNTIPEEDLAKMQVNPIHCDFHPGNLKYENNKAVGIFDFDWSKIDLRLFDIGLGLVYCCSSWVDELDGVLKLEQSEVFLKSYQKKLQELGELPPLNEVEKKYLPTLLAAGNMYLIFWCLRDFYTNEDLNVFEYLAYLQHQVKLMNWIENHKQEIAKIASAL